MKCGDDVLMISCHIYKVSGFERNIQFFINIDTSIRLQHIILTVDERLSLTQIPTIAIEYIDSTHQQHQHTHKQM